MDLLVAFFASSILRYAALFKPSLLHSAQLSVPISFALTSIAFPPPNLFQRPLP